MQVESPYQIIFPTPDQVELFSQASSLIDLYVQKGLMLEQSPEKLAEMASTSDLVLALDESDQVVGSAAITFTYPDGTLEFGAWAVKPGLVKHGIGKHLFVELIKSKGLPTGLIALGNHNSAPILEKFGAITKLEDQVHPAVFEPCLTCACNKSCLPVGRLCVDTIYDLLPVAKKMIEEN